MEILILPLTPPTDHLDSGFHSFNSEQKKRIDFLGKKGKRTVRM